MGKIRNITGGRRFPYNLIELLKPGNWIAEFKYDKQRAKRGWSDRDVWGGGEYIMEVSAGILRCLDGEKGHTDWDGYFAAGFGENYGYTSLGEVAQDLENYLDFEMLSFTDPIYSQLKGDNETRWAIENQLYENAKDAMHFVAENIGGLWD